MWRLRVFFCTSAILIWFCFFPKHCESPASSASPTCLWFGGLFLQLSCKKYGDLLFPVKHLGSMESSPIHVKCCCWLAFSLGTHSHQLMSLSPWMSRSPETEMFGWGRAAGGETDSWNLLNSALGSPHCSSRPLPNEELTTAGCSLGC